MTSFLTHMKMCRPILIFNKTIGAWFLAVLRNGGVLQSHVLSNLWENPKMTCSMEMLESPVEPQRRRLNRLTKRSIPAQNSLPGRISRSNPQPDPSLTEIKFRDSSQDKSNKDRNFHFNGEKWFWRCRCMCLPTNSKTLSFVNNDYASRIVFLEAWFMIYW